MTAANIKSSDTDKPQNTKKGFDLNDFSFLPNALDIGDGNGVDTITYHFKWFMVSPADILEYQKSFDKTKVQKKQVVIAESGVTSQFSINSIEIDSLVGANFKSRNISAVNIRMQLKESFGLTLFDKLIDAAALVGAPSIYETPMFLSLGFKGFDENGEIYSRNNEFLWYVKLVDIKPQTDITGTMYSINLIPMTDLAHREETFALREQITLSNVETVRDFLMKLEDSINKSEKKFKGYVSRLGLLPEGKDFFRIRLEANSKIGEKSFDELRFRKGKKNESVAEKDGSLTFKLEKGWTISRIVDSMYANLEDFSEGTQPGIKTKDEAFEIQTLPRIITRTYFGNFLPDTQEFGKSVEFIIKPFMVTRIQTGEKSDEETKKKRSIDTVEAIKRLELLRKRYDYVFSGKNTQVLSADVDLNGLWAISMSLSPAMLSYRSDDRRSRVLPNLTAVELSEKDLEGLSIVQLYAVRNQITDQEENTLVDNDAQVRKDQIVSKNQSLLNTAISNQEKSLGETVRTADELNLATGRLLLENTSSNFTADVYSKLEIKPRLELRTDPPFERYTINATQPDIGVHKRVTVLEQAYDRGGALLTLDLEIKGDPFWLGPTAADLKKIKENDSTSLTNNAKFDDGENCFYFEYKTPTKIDEDTGLAVMSTSTVVRGVYSVVQVTHRFEEGRFTQSLKSYRNMNVVVK